nr:hypothetical protein [Parvularcula dongshanensis]
MNVPDARHPWHVREEYRTDLLSLQTFGALSIKIDALSFVTKQTARRIRVVTKTERIGSIGIHLVGIMTSDAPMVPTEPGRSLSTCTAAARTLSFCPFRRLSTQNGAMVTRSPEIANSAKLFTKAASMEKRVVALAPLSRRRAPGHVDGAKR